VRLAVIGVGLIGGSIGLAARAHLPSATVSGFDPGAGVLDAARECGAIDEPAASVAEALDGAEACFVCAPVGATVELIAEALAAAGPRCVVTDAGSTKRLITAATDDERFVGGHPVAGAESAGVQNARADLFEGAAWYLTPGERSSGLLYERLHRIVAQLGAHPIAIDAETHDRLLATVSHLPHVLANVLVSQAARALDSAGEALPRIGPSFRDATRVAGANPGIWTDIYATNGELIAAEIEQLSEQLSRVAADLRSGDREAIGSWNEAARGDRRRLLEAELAGGPVHELRVSVPNRPGILAGVALALGKGGVNIVDMALAPAPDNRSGAITFWVAGDRAAERARQLIAELDLPVMEVS